MGNKPLIHYEIRGDNCDDTTISKVNESGTAFACIGQVWLEPGQRSELEKLCELANRALEIAC